MPTGCRSTLTQFLVEARRRDLRPVHDAVAHVRRGDARLHARAMELRPGALHERTGFVFGSRDEVARIERYHGEAGSAGMQSAST